MNNIDNKTRETLNVLRTRPDNAWVEKTRISLGKYISLQVQVENVTDSNSSRIPVRSFNFLFNTNMGKQAKLALSVLASMILLIGGSFATATAANASVPGDLLYGIDRAYEDIQRALKTSPESKAEFEIYLLEERAQELSALEENDSEPDLIEEAVDNITEQEENVQTRLRDSEDNENSDSGELERIRERHELQQQENLKLMEKVQNKYQIKNDENKQDQGQQDNSTNNGSGQSDENGANGGGNL